MQLEELLILDQVARFAEQELAPINAEYNRQGCQLSHVRVSLPDKMKRAFQHYAQADWINHSV